MQLYTIRIVPHPWYLFWSLTKILKMSTSTVADKKGNGSVYHFEGINIGATSWDVLLWFDSAWSNGFARFDKLAGLCKCQRLGLRRAQCCLFKCANSLVATSRLPANSRPIDLVLSPSERAALILVSLCCCAFFHMPAQCGAVVNSTLPPTEPDCQEGDIECPGVVKSASCCWMSCCNLHPVHFIVVTVFRITFTLLFFVCVLSVDLSAHIHLVSYFHIFSLY